MASVPNQLNLAGRSGFDLHCAMLANLCATAFAEAGSHISFRYSPMSLCGQPLVVGFAVELRSLLARTTQGQLALAELGFQPFEKMK